MTAAMIVEQVMTVEQVMIVMAAAMTSHPMAKRLIILKAAVKSSGSYKGSCTVINERKIMTY